MNNIKRALKLLTFYHIFFSYKNLEWLIWSHFSVEKKKKKIEFIFLGCHSNENNIKKGKIEEKENVLSCLKLADEIPVCFVCYFTMSNCFEKVALMLLSLAWLCQSLTIGKYLAFDICDWWLHCVLSQSEVIVFTFRLFLLLFSIYF